MTELTEFTEAMGNLFIFAFKRIEFVAQRVQIVLELPGLFGLAASPDAPGNTLSIANSIERMSLSVTFLLPIATPISQVLFIVEIYCITILRHHNKALEISANALTCIQSANVEKH